jgi:hypothetical protein
MIMEALINTGIELHLPEGGFEPVNQGRRDYRIDTTGRRDFFLRLRGTTYPVLDASANGVRISVDADTVLDIGELVPDCELRLGQDLFAGLRGRVIHCTSVDESQWVAGVEWVDVNVQLAIAMTELMERLRREFFNHD